jgi:hypothetical protein
MKNRIAVLLALVCALAIPYTASAKNMKPGKWQITVTTEMPNMPVKPQPVTLSRCVTKEEADSNEPPKAGMGGDCKILDMKTTGNTISWKVECAKSGVKGEGSASYSGDAYDGSMKMSMNGQEFTTHFAGKYLGDCEK